MGVSWQQADGYDLVLGEFPAPLRRWFDRPAPDSSSLYDTTPIQPTFEDLLAQRDAAEYSRPSLERHGLVIDSRDREAIERHAKRMGWDQ